MKRTMICLLAAAAASTLAASASASTSGASTHPKHQRPARPSAPPISAVPVISCATTYGISGMPSAFVPDRLPTTSTVRGLSFYSNGRITVLAPTGWSCHALVAADGGQVLDVSPSGTPDYTATPIPTGAPVVAVDTDDTGHLPGAELVCDLFPSSAAASEVKQSGLPDSSCPAPAGQRTTQLTPDIVTFTDDAGVKGTGAASGGSLVSTGAMVYPQLSSGSTGSVDVSMLSCTLPKSDSSLCPAIEGDYLVRDAPAYVPQGS